MSLKFIFIGSTKAVATPYPYRQYLKIQKNNSNAIFSEKFQIVIATSTQTKRKKFEHVGSCS